MPSNAEDPDRAAPATPRAASSHEAERPPAGEATPESAERPFSLVPRAGESPSGSHDTLLSAPAPADRLEILLEDRLAEVDRRLAEIDHRLSALERRAPSRVAADEPRASKPWLWLAFLLALAVLFQILRFFG